MILKKLINGTKLQFLFSQVSSRYFSSTLANDIQKLVYVSQSNDIYTNLALEDWLYRNYSFANHNIMMLWCNDPCVVIGRHQNPWLEANLNCMEGVRLARRNSGGGTVYHDRGNLNITIFTARDQYKRKANLEMIVRAVFKRYAVKIDISPREDLLIDGAKVSGTAAKLGQPNAYHHFTLLVDVDKCGLSRALHKEDSGIKTNATTSVKSKILNLQDVNPEITIRGLMDAVGMEYLDVTTTDNFQIINPNEDLYPGINKIRDELKDWEWCFGKTPKFNVVKSFPIPEEFSSSFNSANDDKLNVTMNVEQGRIKEVVLYVPPGLSNNGFTGEVAIMTHLTGCQFTEDVVSSLEESCSWGNIEEFGLLNGRNKFVTESVRR